MDTYKKVNGYDYKEWRTDRSKDPEFTKLITVPGQSITISELVQRKEEGRPIPSMGVNEEMLAMKAAQFGDEDYQADMKVDELTTLDSIERERRLIKDNQKTRTERKAEEKLQAETLKKEQEKVTVKTPEPTETKTKAKEA